MRWQDKLRTLIEANKQGKFGDWSLLLYSEPLEAERIDAILWRLSQLGLPVPEPLSELYHITNGMSIGHSFTVFGLVSEEFRGLEAINNSFLQLLQELTSGASIKLLFGADDVGDFLCLTEEQSVVLTGHNTPIAEVLADSLEAFFDDVCMGPGYIRFFQPKDEDPWVSVLKQFGFL